MPIRSTNTRGRTLQTPPQGGYTQADLGDNFNSLNRRVSTQLARSPYVLGSVTGSVGTPESTAETALMQVKFRAGLMGPRGMLRVSFAMVGTGTAASRVLRIRFGDGTGGAGDLVAGSISSGVGVAFVVSLGTAYIVNQEAANSQRAIFNAITDVNTSFLPIVTTTTLAIDTDVTPSGLNTNEAIVVSLTGQTADAADELTATFLLVELFPSLAA